MGLLPLQVIQSPASLRGFKASGNESVLDTSAVSVFMLYKGCMDVVRQVRHWTRMLWRGGM